MNSEKSQVNLKPTSFIFDPLHVTFLNFTKEASSEHITSLLSVVSCLPVDFVPTVECNSYYEDTQYSMHSHRNARPTSRHEKFKGLHGCIVNFIHGISDKSVKAISVGTKLEPNFTLTFLFLLPLVIFLNAKIFLV